MNIPKLKPTQCVVLYEYFFEQDCFGGGDTTDEFKIFNSKEEALVFIEKMRDNFRYSSFVGPLKLA